LREKLLTQISSRVRAIQSDLKGIDYLQFISGLNDPLDPNLLIDELCFLFYPQPMTTEQKLFFKDILIQGLPDFEWTDEYSAYLANPDDQDIRVAVEQKLKNMFTAMWNVPEFHLS